MSDNEINENLKTVKCPISWKCWPLLSMTRGDIKNRELGFMLATGKPVIYIGNMYEIGLFGVMTLRNIMDTSQLVKYDSFDDMINDGWRMD